MNTQPNLKWNWFALDQLSNQQLEQMFALRQLIFIVEQDCPYPDIDGKDSKAQHLLVWEGDILIATLRVFECYKEYDNKASIGRICVKESARKYGIGKELVQRAVDYIEKEFDRKDIQIGAQFYLKRFYQALGFKQISEIYDEDGIDHIHMLFEF